MFLLITQKGQTSEMDVLDSLTHTIIRQVRAHDLRTHGSELMLSQTDPSSKLGNALHHMQSIGTIFTLFLHVKKNLRAR